MRLKHLFAFVLAVILSVSLLSVAPIETDAAAVPIKRSITISVANRDNGSTNPAALLDSGAAPFDTGGPFTVTGYYKFKEIAPLGDDAYAEIFGVRISDTQDEWQPFSASFNSAEGLKGMVLWYMAGDVSMANVLIKNANGQEVYNMSDDEQLTTGSVVSLTQKGIWYLWNYDSRPGSLAVTTVNVYELKTGLIPGSVYTVDDEQRVSDVPAGTTVAALKSNFDTSEAITVLDKDGNPLNDSDPVPSGAQVVYYQGTADESVYVLENLTGDLNGDGRIDVRDLRLVKESTFGDGDVDQAAADLSQNGAVDTDDVDLYRSAIVGTDPLTRSAGADVLLNECNPVGRLYKKDDAMYMEHSASNFTVTGNFAGDVVLNLFVDDNPARDDAVGIFVEIDGEMSHHQIDTYNQDIEVKIAENLPAGEHTIKVSKATDAVCDSYYIHSLTYTGTLKKSAPAKHRIEFLGDSITAGVGVFNVGNINYIRYGLSTSYFSYANLTADALDADYYAVAIGGWQLCATVNPQIAIPTIYPYWSVEDTTDDGLYDFAWQPEVVVINLGTNDWNNPEEAIRLNAQQLLKTVREKNPGATIIWAYGMMDEDHDNVAWIEEEVQNFAQSDSNTYFVHLPENTDGWAAHPDVNGHSDAADVLTQEIQRIMGW